MYSVNRKVPNPLAHTERQTTSQISYSHIHIPIPSVYHLRVYHVPSNPQSHYSSVVSFRQELRSFRLAGQIWVVLVVARSSLRDRLGMYILLQWNIVRLFNHELYSAYDHVGAGGVLIVFASGGALSPALNLPPKLSIAGRSVRLLDVARVGSAAKSR